MVWKQNFEKEKETKNKNRKRRPSFPKVLLSSSPAPLHTDYHSPSEKAGQKRQPWCRCGTCTNIIYVLPTTWFLHSSFSEGWSRERWDYRRVLTFRRETRLPLSGKSFPLVSSFSALRCSFRLTNGSSIKKVSKPRFRDHTLAWSHYTCALALCQLRTWWLFHQKATLTVFELQNQSKAGIFAACRETPKTGDLHHQVNTLSGSYISLNRL